MIAVLTYNHPHRKTQEVIFGLLADGIKPLVIATQWEERNNFKPLIAHRPAKCLDIPLEAFTKNLGVELVITTKENLYDTLLKYKGSIEYILLTTGNVIQNEIVNEFKVINSHPGYLPVIKGLDAIKWAILHKETIGVTTHFVNTELDGGIIIERQIVPLNSEDTFHSFAFRQYEMEVEMLLRSFKVKPENVNITESKYGTFRRMPNRLEPEMMERFEEMRKNTNHG